MRSFEPKAEILTNEEAEKLVDNMTEKQIKSFLKTLEKHLKTE